MYGPPTPDEAKTGLNNHGEADVVEWHKIKSGITKDGVTFVYGADLPKTQYRVQRTVHLPEGERFVHVEESIENLTDFDRPYNLMEHATFGPPFVDPGKTVLDGSATRGQVGADPDGAGSLRAKSAVQWPNGVAPDGKPVNLRVFQPKDHSGVYYTMRLDPTRKDQFFALFNPDYRVLIGYIFPADPNPWLADWQENHRFKEIPWNGEVVARGIEFGTSPFDEGPARQRRAGVLLRSAVIPLDWRPQRHQVRVHHYVV
jgi:hypothetical protein